MSGRKSVANVKAVQWTHFYTFECKMLSVIKALKDLSSVFKSQYNAFKSTKTGCMKILKNSPNIRPELTLESLVHTRIKNVSHLKKKSSGGRKILCKNYTVEAKKMLERSSGHVPLLKTFFLLQKISSV